MLTFEAVVSRTWDQLVAKQPRADVPRDMAERVLRDVGIGDLLQRAAEPTAPRRLLVRRVWISGRKTQAASETPMPFRYDQTLGPGINGWVAGNGAGKSTVLKTIVWAVTGIQPTFKPDVRLWIEAVAVEIAIDHAVYTISYEPRVGQPGVTGKIVAADVEAVVAGQDDLPIIESFSGLPTMRDAIARFFSSRMEFVPLQSVQHKQFSVDLQERTISWDVYAQAVYLGADNYGDYLFPTNNLNGRHHQKTLSTYLGLGLAEAVSRLEVERDQAQQRHVFEVKRVAVNAQGVREMATRLESELRDVEDRIEAIDAGRSVLVDPTHVATVRAQIANWMTQVAELTDAEQTLLADDQRIRNDRDKEQRISRELRERIQFKLFFSGISVEQCPHCEQAIPQARIEEELTAKQCRVCHSQLHPISSTNHYEALLRESEQKVADLEATLRSTKRELARVIRQREAAEQEAERYRRELRDLPRQEQAGFTTELRTLLDQQGYLRGQLAQLSTQTPESQAEGLKELKYVWDILRTAHGVLQTEVSQQHHNLISRLEARATDLAQAFGVPNLERVWLDKRFELFVRQTGRNVRYAAMDQSEQLRLKIAFHLALLTLRVTDGIGRHPGFLIVDAPGGAEMDDQRLGAIFRGFADTKARLGDQIQILIASTKAELAALCDPGQAQHRAGTDPIF